MSLQYINVLNSYKLYTGAPAFMQLCRHVFVFIGQKCSSNNHDMMTSWSESESVGQLERRDTIHYLHNQPFSLSVKN